MSQAAFADRRQPSPDGRSGKGDRRQFADGHDRLSPQVRELADAIDRYKLEHHRRFIDHEELLNVVLSLGYSKQPAPFTCEPSDAEDADREPALSGAAL